MNFHSGVVGVGEGVKFVRRTRLRLFDIQLIRDQNLTATGVCFQQSRGLFILHFTREEKKEMGNRVEIEFFFFSRDVKKKKTTSSWDSLVLLIFNLKRAENLQVNFFSKNEKI